MALAASARDLGADGKTNAPARFLGAIGKFEPVEQFALMAGGISPKIALPNIVRQRGKGQLGAGQGGACCAGTLLSRNSLGYSIPFQSANRGAQTNQDSGAKKLQLVTGWAVEKSRRMCLRLRHAGT
jgi:hypothetical protein